MLDITVVGHLGNDAVINETNGRKVINFSVAHTEKYKDAQGVVNSKTIWVECAKWGDSIGVAQYLKKGTQVVVTGRPEANGFMRKDGTADARLKCTVNFLQLLGSSTHQPQPQASTPAPAPSVPNGTSFQQVPSFPVANSTDSVDDLPF